mmetsp:Transcript_106619/g.168447  ORF Transcript_106619/g.168447 Transcript_106619/m.168447 type:complete len:89 (+) Transcript_106619:436-702(+)
MSEQVREWYTHQVRNANATETKHLHDKNVSTRTAIGSRYVEGFREKQKRCPAGYGLSSGSRWTHWSAKLHTNIYRRVLISIGQELFLR